MRGRLLNKLVRKVNTTTSELNKLIRNTWTHGYVRNTEEKLKKKTSLTNDETHLSWKTKGGTKEGGMEA